MMRMQDLIGSCQLPSDTTLSKAKARNEYHSHAFASSNSNIIIHTAVNNCPLSDQAILIWDVSQARAESRYVYCDISNVYSHNIL